MTIASTYAPQQYIGNGVTTIFAFPFEFYNSTDLMVKSTVIATGVTTTLSFGVDYVVTGGSGSTGNVVMVAAPASTIRLTIERSIPYTQPADYQENTAFPAETLETSLDKAVLMAQQTRSATDYALKFPVTDPSTAIGEIPGSVARANSIFSFGADGKPSAVALASLGATINVSLASPQNGDALIYNAGVWNNRSTLASLGTNIASASTTAISAADSDFVTVTGTTGITSFGTPASLARKHIWVVFSGILTLTHNATSLILPGAANYTTAAGDVLECVHISGANWRVVTITKANGTAVAVTATGPTMGTAVATTSGTAIDFTGIPSTVKQIIMSLDGVSTATNGNFYLQIGDSGGIETAAYKSTGSVLSSAAVSSNFDAGGFYFNFGTNTLAFSGLIILTLLDSSTNTWSCFGAVESDAPNTMIMSGSKSLSATLDRVRFTTPGAVTFDAGKMNIQYI